MSLKTLLSVADVRSGNGAPEDIAAARVAVDWMDKRITQPHPLINRPRGASQVICPFLPMSMRANVLSFAVHHEFDGNDPSVIIATVRSYFEMFRTQTRQSKVLEQLRALAIVLPNVTGERMKVLTDSQQILKDELVPQAHMVGEFYETCGVGATYNPDFPVMWSPIPLMALRNMLVHDVQFLKHSKRLFAEFDKRFGEHFSSPDRLPHGEHHLFAHYQEARTKYAA